MKPPLEKKVFAGFGLAAALLGAAGAFSFRAVVAEMAEEERGLVREREDRTHRTTRRAEALAVGGGVAAFLALAWAMWTMRRELAARRRAEAALRQARDESESRVQERTATLHRTNRRLRMISECNQVLVHAADQAALLQSLCRLIVEHGGYRMAWAGFAEQDEAKTVRPVARFGFETGYLDRVNISWADTERGPGPTGTAIRTGRPVIARNIPTDPAYGPWRAAAIQRGCASSVALPLQQDGRCFGASMVYAAEPDGFDAAEVGLLTELANDLAYGIAALRERDERQRAEEEKSRRNE